MNTEQLYGVIKAPCVTEKGTKQQMVNNQYLLEVAANASKYHIKQAVEMLYKVKVLSVNTVNVRSQEKRVGKTVGHTKAWKKAYVTIEKGQSIPLFNIE